MSECDVLVVGAGPTGLAMACELARRGIAVRIVDQKTGPSAESRALGVQAHTLELLEKIGVADQAVAQGLRLEGGAFANRTSPIGELIFAAEGTRYPFVLSLPQSTTERLLIARLNQLGVDVEWHTSLVEMAPQPDWVSATLELPSGEREIVAASWLVGCDGAHSVVRSQLGVPFEGEREPEWFALADVRTDWALARNRAHVFFHSDGPLAVFPLPETNTLRVIAPLLTGGSESAPQPDLRQFEELIATRSGSRVTLDEGLWLSNFRISRRIVDRYRVGRVLLAGDAAHVHSPVGGQGMNTGLHDVFNLAWKLALVVQQRAEERLLDSYHAERHPIGAQVLQGTRLATRMIALRSRAAQMLRDSLLRYVVRLKWTRRKLFRTIGMLDIHYRDSRLVEDDVNERGHRHDVRAGDRAPDFGLVSPDDSTITRLHEVLRSTKHVLLWFESGEESDAQLREQLEASCRQWDDLLECYCVGSECEIGDEAKVRPLYAARHTQGYRPGMLYLVRPDGYVAWRGSASRLNRLQRYLSRWYLMASVVSLAAV